MDSTRFPTKRHLPKLMACMTKSSLDQFRSKALYAAQFLDKNGVRRRKRPLHECLIAELHEGGYADASGYLEDLIYDNLQLVNEDDIGIVVDLRKREDYLKNIAGVLQQAETERENGNTKKECLLLLNLAMSYSEKEKGILWLAEKFFQASIAISSQYLIDGGRLKAICKYHFGKFLLDKFPGADTEEANSLLTKVRDCSIGKGWLLYEAEEDEEIPPDTVFASSALQLLRVLLNNTRAVRKVDVAKAERLARLAERRAKDADAKYKIAEAITEIGICQLMMNNLNNAQNTFERALKIHENSQNIQGICEVKMHLAAVMLRLGEYETAIKLLTEMGASAMEHSLRRELGLALHLLGELHLRREKPELGTPHLAEAFLCFMGFHFDAVSKADFTQPRRKENTDEDNMSALYRPTNEVYAEEAEQSRLMTAISAGQELMASYFNLLNEAGECTVSKMKTIEWKLSHTGWWIKKVHHDFLPCPCPVHNRSPLDVMRKQIEYKASGGQASTIEEELDRRSNIQDMRLRHSSYAIRAAKSQV